MQFQLRISVNRQTLKKKYHPRVIHAKLQTVFEWLTYIYYREQHPSQAKNALFSHLAKAGCKYCTNLLRVSAINTQSREAVVVVEVQAVLTTATVLL